MQWARSRRSNCGIFESRAGRPSCGQTSRQPASESVLSCLQAAPTAVTACAATRQRQEQPCFDLSGTVATSAVLRSEVESRTRSVTGVHVCEVRCGLPVVRGIATAGQAEMASVRSCGQSELISETVESSIERQQLASNCSRFGQQRRTLTMPSAGIATCPRSDSSSRPSPQPPRRAVWRPNQPMPPQPVRSRRCSAHGSGTASSCSAGSSCCCCCCIGSSAAQ